MYLIHMEAGDSNAGTSSSSTQSALTLVPIHSAISYHLSLDNLRCIRRRIPEEVEKVCIKDLSYEDKCTSVTSTSYRWSNEIYFYRGTFLQKQKIICSLPKGYENSPESFTACPHQSLSISAPEFLIENNLDKVQACLIYNPPRCSHHLTEKWSNTHGPYAKITACTICHLVSECSLKLRNRNFCIKYTCYKDLGPGTDLHHPKWLASLTGAGNPHLQENRHERLYAPFWRIVTA